MPLGGQGHPHRVGQGRRRQVVGHGQPGRGAGGPGPHRRRARRRHLGLLRPPHARGRGPAGRRRRTRAASRWSRSSGRSGDGVAAGRVDGPARRRRGDRPHVAGPHAQPRRAALPAGRPLGRRPRLPARRHAAGHRRRADGRGQAAAPRRGHRGHHAGPRRAEGGGPGGRHGPQELPAGGRRDREHERLPLRPRRDLRPVRRGRRAGAGRTTPACRCSARCRSSRRCRPAATTGTPVALADGPAAEAFRAIADHIVDEAVPLAAMAGCSARMLDAAVAALDARDAADA